MDRRTALISAASVVGVVLAGATAVGANIGILDRADDTGFGELSAASAAVSTMTPEVIDVYLDGAAPTSASSSSTSVQVEAPADATPQPFAVEDAGVVEVVAADGGIRLGEITANPGWTSSVTGMSDDRVSVTFDTNGGPIYLFEAHLGSDGSIAASVEQPVVEIVTTSTSPAPAYDDYDDDEYEEYEEYDDDDEDEDEDDDEHEGRDDDD